LTQLTEKKKECAGEIVFKTDVLLLSVPSPHYSALSINKLDCGNIRTFKRNKSAESLMDFRTLSQIMP
jgi:hypothetical protein